MEITQLISYIKTREREIFMRELYQGMNATLSNMTEEEIRKYGDETYENMRKETRREIKHEVEKEYQKKEKEYQKKMDETLLNEKKKAALRLYSKGMNEKEIAEIVDADPQQVDEWFVSENGTPYGEKKTEA